MGDDGQAAEAVITSSEPAAVKAPPQPPADAGGRTEDRRDDFNAFLELTGEKDDAPEETGVAAPGQPAPKPATPVAQPKPAGIKPKDVDAAARAFQRDGWETNEIDALKSKDPAQFVAIGTRLARRQADQDRFGNEFHKLQSRLDEIEQRSKAPTPQRREEPDDPELIKIIEPLAQQYGEEMREPMRALARAVVGRAQEQATREATALREQLSTLSALVEQRELDAARERQTRNYPMLADDDQYAVVVDKMKQLHKTGEYRSFDALMADAASILFYPTIRASVQNELTEDRAARTAGQPTIPSQRTPPRALSKDEAEWVAFELAERGDTEAQIRAKLGGLRGA